MDEETGADVSDEDVGADVIEVVGADVVTWLLAPVVGDEDPDGVYVNGGTDSKAPLMLYAAWHSTRLKPSGQHQSLPDVSLVQ